MEKCAHCPARHLARPCLAQTSGHARYCVLTDPSSPDYRPAYVELLAGTALTAEPRANPHTERLLLVWGCDYRSDALDECGCTARRCCGLRRGKWDREPHAVDLADCLACVSAPDRPAS